MAGVSAQPRDALVMAGILRDLGVGEHEPRVINQMLEFAFRYSTQSLEDARAFADLAGHPRIEPEDVVAGLENRAETSFARPPPRDLVLELAKEKNSVPLPPIRLQYGLRLPPDRHCLLQPNYRLRPDAATYRQPPQTYFLPSSSSQAQPPVQQMQQVYMVGGLKRKLEEDDYDHESLPISKKSIPEEPPAKKSRHPPIKFP